MIVDTSAIMAVLNSELGWLEILDILQDQDDLKMSNGNHAESFIVTLHKYGSGGFERLEKLILESRIQTVPVIGDDIGIIKQAYTKYGKGQGHPAQLNFGDCFAYALAKRMNEPLLCVGNDFHKTDIAVVPLEKTSP